MDLATFHQTAVAVVREHAPELEVLGVTSAEGGSHYTEIFLMLRGCAEEPCRLVLGVSRDMTPTALRQQIAEQLAQHLSEHGRLTTRSTHTPTSA